MAIIVIDK